MKNFCLGKYIPGDTFVYKLDPRAKILSTIILMIAVFFLENIYEMLGALLLIILFLLISKISVFKALTSIKPLIILSLFVFFFQILFNQEGKILYTTRIYLSFFTILLVIAIIFIFYYLKKIIPFRGILTLVEIALIIFSLILFDIKSFYIFEIDIYKSGLITSIFVFFRLIVIVLLATILTITTKPNDLTNAFEWLLKPLKIFKIEPEEIALIITIALRYIPTILDEAYKIMDSQASRGADFRSGSLKKKISQIVSLIIPMFVLSFERSDELSDAMIVRNYVPGKKKTKYHILKWSYRDTIFMIFNLIILGGSLCLMIIF